MAGFAAAISIVSANEVTLPLKIAFGLFVPAIPLLLTAGVICEFILSEDIDRQRGEKFILRFSRPGYYLAAAGLIALSAYLFWWLAAISAILIAIGYFFIRYVL